MRNPLETEANYPFIFEKWSLPNKGRGTCQNNKNQVTGFISGIKLVPKHNANALINALQEGPVSVAVDASSIAFRFYASGVVTSHTCGKKINHNMLAVGYGIENGE